MNANEREKLMGFPAWHTLQMCKKMPETIQEQALAEDMRCSAVGNSFRGEEKEGSEGDSITDK